MLDVSNNYIKTGRQEFDDLIPAVASFLEADLLELSVDGQTIRGYRSPDSPAVWIRDYSDMLRGIRLFEKDVKSTISHFADNQSANGRIFDFFTTLAEPTPGTRENWTRYVRVPVEADVEYRFIKAVFLAWQAHGDDAWLESLLPKCQQALEYIFQYPIYYHPDYQLIKRPFTIDTWDFAYTAGSHDWLQFQIDDQTCWGFFHGDQSGYYEALKIMEYLYGYFNHPGLRDQAASQAEVLRTKANQHCWNGNFYRHFIHLTPCPMEGVNESQQLSLSNPMDINRGLTDHNMAVQIIREYLRRQSNETAFAEWFSIDPPFPDGIFGDQKLKGGIYINGGIFPLAGGELALAAFNHGFESYGVDILKKYARLIRKYKGSWLWYFPNGTPSTRESGTSPDATSTDGWGSTAMLHALTAGLAGVDDQSKQFHHIRLSPRWLSAGIDRAEVQITYAATGASLKYLYNYQPGIITLNLEGTESEAVIHLMIPAGIRIQRVAVNNTPHDFQLSSIESSRYIDLNIQLSGEAQIRITYTR